ncbi:MAG: ABC transporter ATP-binding protein [Pseudomonadota bacterium]
MTVPAPVLRVKDLSVRFRTARGVFEAVRSVSFDLGRERVGVVGESGSGKTMMGRAIMGIAPKTARVEAEHLEFMGQDLKSLSAKQMRALRGRRISMILQDPKYSLNPLMTIGEQVAEAYRLHGSHSRHEARERALEMLEAVQIRDPKRVYRLFPHEVSGGMGQRVMISMMLAGEPDLVIADEPTSALDVSVQKDVLRILDRLVDERGHALLFISHDLNLVSRFCDRVLIMYAGRVVEELSAQNLHHARHAYTQGLLASLPKLGAKRDVLPVLNRDPRWRDAPAVQ